MASDGILKLRIDLLKESLITFRGVVDFLITGPIALYIIIKYGLQILTYLKQVIPITTPYISTFLAYLLFTPLLSITAIIISYALKSLIDTFKKP